MTRRGADVSVGYPVKGLDARILLFRSDPAKHQQTRCRHRQGEQPQNDPM